MRKIKLPVSLLADFLETCNRQGIPVTNGDVFGDDFGAISYNCMIEDKFLTNLLLSRFGQSIIISDDKLMIPFDR